MYTPIAAHTDELLLKVYTVAGQEVYSGKIPRPANLENPNIDFGFLPLTQGMYIGKLFSTAVNVDERYNTSKISIVIN